MKERGEMRIDIVRSRKEREGIKIGGKEVIDDG
jgi:hypothetical protein